MSLTPNAITATTLFLPDDTLVWPQLICANTLSSARCLNYSITRQKIEKRSGMTILFGVTSSLFQSRNGRDDDDDYSRVSSYKLLFLGDIGGYYTSVVKRHTLFRHINPSHINHANSHQTSRRNWKFTASTTSIGAKTHKVSFSLSLVEK